jgi:Putative prokaryotic signal transducing protein
MRVILRSTDLSLIQSAQIALEAQDIATVLSDDNSTGLPSSPASLAVVDDKDFDQAMVILAKLERTRTRPWWQASWAPRALLFVIVLLMLVLGASLFL